MATLGVMTLIILIIEDDPEATWNRKINGNWARFKGIQGYAEYIARLPILLSNLFLIYVYITLHIYTSDK